MSHTTMQKQLAWQRITKPGQVKAGDKLRFTIGDEKFNETAKLVIDAGGPWEEIIYNKRRNFYLITSMAIVNDGCQKNVEFLGEANNEPSMATANFPHGSMGEEVAA